MKHSIIKSVVVIGVSGHLIDVEVDIGEGLPGFSIVGLPDTAVAEARDRVKAAVRNSDLIWPNRKVTVSLSPAGLPKNGAGIDLAIAVAVLVATKQLNIKDFENFAVLGELGLDGKVKAVRGALPAAIAASESLGNFLTADGCAAQCTLVENLNVVAVSSLKELVEIFKGIAKPKVVKVKSQAKIKQGTDMSEVSGHVTAKWGLECAAAGGHHVAMIGPPGVGKTLLAERFNGIMPALSKTDALTVSAIRSSAGLLNDEYALDLTPPFVAPHHTATHIAVIGGGYKSAATVGLISQAHNGVLFLDEAPEFSRNVLESLRQPLESGRVVIARANFVSKMPARFQLLIAANLCPCGPSVGQKCNCSMQSKIRYASKLSGPLMDRIDIRLRLYVPTQAEIALDLSENESSETIANRVAIARERMEHRYKNEIFKLNAHMTPKSLRTDYRLGEAGDVLQDALRRGVISIRGVDRVARLSWTASDLRGNEKPTKADVLAALSLRDAEGKWAA